MLSMSSLVSGGRLVRKRMLLGGCWSSWATSEEGEGGKGKEEEELRPQVHKSASYTNHGAVETPATLVHYNKLLWCNFPSGCLTTCLCVQAESRQCPFKPVHV